MIEKDLAGNRRRITCSSPKKSRKNSTPGSPGKIQRLKEPRKNSTSGGEQCQHQSEKIFTLLMMCRSILSSLTEACTLQAHASQMLHIDNDHRHLLTKPVGITLVNACIEGTQWKPIRSPRRFDQNWDSHESLQAAAGCMLDVTWVAHTLHIQSTTRTLASTLTSHVNGTNYR